MNRMQEQVTEFHKAFGLPVATKPTLETNRFELKLRLIHEEFLELQSATDNRFHRPEKNTQVEIADQLTDLLYVTFGMAVELGIDLEPIFDIVHKSNMTKLGTDGKPVVREDGKIIKGPNFKHPAGDIATELARQRGEL